ATVETEIYLLTTTLYDLPAAAALSVLQLVVVVALLAVTARFRATRTAVQRRPTVPRRPTRHDTWALLATAGLLVYVASPLVTLVSGSLRVGGEWSLGNSRALATTGQYASLPVPVTEALATSLRTAVDATWMAVGVGLLLAVVVTRRSRSATERRLRSGLDGLLMLPLGVSAVTLGFGLLVTLDSGVLDLRNSPLLVPIAQALV